MKLRKALTILILSILLSPAIALSAEKKFVVPRSPTSIITSPVDQPSESSLRIESTLSLSKRLKGWTMWPVRSVSLPRKDRSDLSGSPHPALVFQFFSLI